MCWCVFEHVVGVVYAWSVAVCIMQLQEILYEWLIVCIIVVIVYVLCVFVWVGVCIITVFI